MYDLFRIVGLLMKLPYEEALKIGFLNDMQTSDLTSYHECFDF